MTTLIEPPSLDDVIEATRHLCDFRTGMAELLVRLAEEATQHLPGEGMKRLEPALRILGPEKAIRLAGRLYRVASDVTADPWDGMPDRDEAERVLRYAAEEAAGAIAAEFHRDSCICRAVGR